MFPVLRTLRFDSLRTGKRIQSRNRIKNRKKTVDSFDSLPTGKRIQSLVIRTEDDLKSGNVSIPFARESVSKGAQKGFPIFYLSSCFDSLPTGRRSQRN